MDASFIKSFYLFRAIDNSKIDLFQVSIVNLFDSPDRPAFQADLNAMGMGWRFCQNILHNSFCEFSGSLILF